MNRVWTPRATSPAPSEHEIAQLVGAVLRSIPGLAAPLPEAFVPAHLPVALIDAVFRAQSEGKDAGRISGHYCLYAGIERTRASPWHFPPPDAQQTLADLIDLYGRLGPDGVAKTVLRSDARFPDTGASCAECIFRLAQALREFGVDTLQDMGALLPCEFDLVLRNEGAADPRVVHLLLSYTGEDDFVWGDVNVRGFVADALGIDWVSANHAELLVRHAAYELILSPRYLDFRIRTVRAEPEPATCTGGTNEC